MPTLEEVSMGDQVLDVPQPMTDEDIIDDFITLTQAMKSQSNAVMSRPNFSSHEGTYYNPSVGKPNHNPEPHIQGVRVETKQD